MQFNRCQCNKNAIWLNVISLVSIILQSISSCSSFLITLIFGQSTYKISKSLNLLKSTMNLLISLMNLLISAMRVLMWKNYLNHLTMSDSTSLVANFKKFLNGSLRKYINKNQQTSTKLSFISNKKPLFKLI